MQVTEISAEGLKREFKIVVPAADIGSRMDAKVEEIKGQIKLPGFRPGKVPVAVIKQRFGQSLLQEILQEQVDTGANKAMSDNELRPATQPSIDFPEGFEGLVENEDLEFSMSLEIMPDVPEQDFSTLSLTREVAEIDDAEIDKRLEQLAEMQTSYEDKDEGAEAADGDALTIDFVGKVDGEEFEGGSAEGVDLVIGQGRFIPGFEEQLVGAKAGDETVVKVTFPEDYQAEHLAGKDAEFDVKVSAIKAPVKTEIDDALAEKFGMEDLATLKTRVKEQVENEYSGFSREKVKRELLDKLDDMYEFEVPASLLDAEFNQIWQQFSQEMEQQEKTFDDMEKSEDEYKDEYKTIAKRRVKLGLVLAEIGRQNKIEVPNEELSQAIAQQAQRFPGQEQQVFQYYQQNPEALAQIRAPMLEDKVVDYVVELAQVTDKTVSVEELMKMHDEEEPHEHGPDCDHDH